VPVVWGDHDRLEQVFLNLLENAFRHNPDGTRVHVEVRGNSAADVVVSVKDDGSGMPSDIAAALNGVQPERRRATAGSGLGLSIARGIIDAHGGAIELERTARGTHFSIRLPVDHGGAAARHRLALGHDRLDD
jgi:signal transduction histidine kinase